MAEVIGAAWGWLSHAVCRGLRLCAWAVGCPWLGPSARKLPAHWRQDPSTAPLVALPAARIDLRAAAKQAIPMGQHPSPLLPARPQWAPRATPAMSSCLTGTGAAMPGPHITTSTSPPQPPLCSGGRGVACAWQVMWRVLSAPHASGLGSSLVGRALAIGQH